MLKVKLTRIGRKNQPQYRVVVNEAKSKRDGAFTDFLGHYNPLASTDSFKIDLDKYQDWLKKGAQPTDTVRHLVNKLIASKKKPATKKKPTTKKPKTTKKKQTK